MDKLPLHEDFLKKEEEKERWVEYWVVLRSSGLYFYDDQRDSWHEYSDKIEITPGTKCSVVRRKTYSHRFKLITDEGTWLLKCHTNLQRHRWMHAIELAMREISTDRTDCVPAATTTTRGCLEQELFGRSFRRELRQQEAAAAAGRQSNNNTFEDLGVNRNTELNEGSKRKTRNPRKSSEVKKSTHNDKHATVAFKALKCEDVCSPDYGNELVNLAFSDDEDISKHNNCHAPVVRLIRVESASKPPLSTAQ